MSWSTIWELTKINVLYSNPQSMSQIKKKREKNPNKTYTAYKSVMRQQLFLIVLFTLIFFTNFSAVDFKAFPGVFTQYLASFFIMSIFYSFSAMYSIFYDSKDLGLYAPLPIKQSEVYLAKVISSLGMGAVFLLPILAMLTITYWRIMGPIGVVLAVINFLIIFVTCITLSLLFNHLLGRLVVKSQHRKLFSSLLMIIVTVVWIAIWVYLNFSSTHYDVTKQNVDRPLLPYFRGFYDIAVHPFSTMSIYNFYLPLLLVLLLVLIIAKFMVPRFYQETLYSSSAHQKLRKNKAYKDSSLGKTLVRHHLSTIQNGPLLIQTYLPLLFPLMMLIPGFMNGGNLFERISQSFFGIAWLIGMIMGVMSATPSSLVGVGLSLEKENYYVFKALPINFKTFVKQKYLVLAGLQIFIPVLILMSISLAANLSLLLLINFLVAYILTSFVMGQIFYSRDYRLLVLNWQDITHLFNRGGGQWLIFSLILGGLFIGLPLVILAIVLAQFINPWLISLVFVLLGLSTLGLLQFIVNRSFWKKLN
ncbi:hypothetical protein ACVR0S_07915 [Streptococcus dentapri]|uniref:ABC transporter permease n=1 Tax=Streptococcus dentapri TaxID=573564 RepID=A0ABV8D278_9STRE